MIFVGENGKPSRPDQPELPCQPKRVELDEGFGPITIPAGDDSTGARAAVRRALAAAHDDSDVLPEAEVAADEVVAIVNEPTTPESPAIRMIIGVDIGTSFTIDAMNSVRLPAKTFSGEKRVSHLTFEILVDRRIGEAPPEKYFIVWLNETPVVCKINKGDVVEILAILDKDVPVRPVDGLAFTDFGGFLLISKDASEAPWTEGHSYDCTLKITDPYDAYQAEKALRGHERAADVAAKATTLEQAIDWVRRLFS